MDFPMFFCEFTLLNSQLLKVEIKPEVKIFGSVDQSQVHNHDTASYVGLGNNSGNH